VREQTSSFAKIFATWFLMVLSETKTRGYLFVREAFRDELDYVELAARESHSFTPRAFAQQNSGQTRIGVITVDTIRLMHDIKSAGVTSLTT
jgi:hypothetical protein